MPTNRPSSTFSDAAPAVGPSTAESIPGPSSFDALRHIADEDLVRAARHYRRALAIRGFAGLPSAAAVKLERHLTRTRIDLERELARRGLIHRLDDGPDDARTAPEAH